MAVVLMVTPAAAARQPFALALHLAAVVVPVTPLAVSVKAAGKDMPVNYPNVLALLLNAAETENVMRPLLMALLGHTANAERVGVALTAARLCVPTTAQMRHMAPATLRATGPSASARWATNWVLTWIALCWLLYVLANSNSVRAMAAATKAAQHANVTQDGMVLTVLCLYV